MVSEPIGRTEFQTYEEKNEREHRELSQAVSDLRVEMHRELLTLTWRLLGGGLLLLGIGIAVLRYLE